MKDVGQKRFGDWWREFGCEIPEESWVQYSRKNFRNRLGEIDIIVEYEGHPVICEVKSRSSGKIDPSLFVILAKRTKHRKLYEVSITRHPNRLIMQPRFDVI